MIHENWIPIEEFDKVAKTEVSHLFLTAYIDKQTGRVYSSYDAGYWADWGCFWNGDCQFDPTHYLNPTCYKKETL